MLVQIFLINPIRPQSAELIGIFLNIQQINHFLNLQLFKQRMLQVSTHHLTFNPGVQKQCLILKNVSQSALIFKIKANNIQVVDAKPNVSYLSQKQSCNVIVRYLKGYPFHAKLQIISAEVPQIQDPKNMNIPEEFKKIPKEKTKCIMISVAKEQGGWSQETNQISDKALIKKAGVSEQITDENMMQSLHANSNEGFGVKSSFGKKQQIIEKTAEQPASKIKRPVQKRQIESNIVKEQTTQVRIKPQNILKKQSVLVEAQSQDANKKQKIDENKVMTQQKVQKDYRNDFKNQLSTLINNQMKLSIKTILIIIVFFYILGFLNGRFGHQSTLAVQTPSQEQKKVQLSALANDTQPITITE